MPANDYVDASGFDWHGFFERYDQEQNRRTERFLKTLEDLRDHPQEGAFKLQRYCDLESHEDCNDSGCWLSDD